MLKNSLTGKQKSFLCSEGMKLEPVVMIGKDAVTPAVVQSARDVIKKRELIKVRVLQNSADDAEQIRSMIETLTERVDAELVQIIGRNGLLFKRNLNKPKIELP